MLVIGACPVHLGVHWLTDVIVGGLIGVAVGAGVASWVRRIELA